MTVYPAPGFLLVELLKSDTTVDGIYKGEEDKKAPVQAKVIRIGYQRDHGENPILLPRFETGEESDKQLVENDTICFVRGGDRPLDEKQSLVPFEHILGLVEEGK